jgi:hypothetical protein
VTKKRTVAKKRVPRRIPKPTGSPRDYLEKLSKQELIEFILDAAKEYPRIHQRLTDIDGLDKGNIAQVTETIRTEIQAMARDNSGYDDFSNDDFYPIEERLSKLLKSGHPDEVVSLGSDFIKIAPLRYEYNPKFRS